MMTDALIPTLKIEFIIPGQPQQQGSKIVSRSGGMYDANKKLAPWRAEGIAAAQAAYQGPKLVGPVTVVVDFYFARPGAHYGTGRNAAKLKPGAPVFHAQTPDADKCARAVGDILTQAGLIRDDKQIVRWQATKYWAETARTEVRIVPAGDQ